MSDQPSPRRRFQFRLRTLMIGVTLLAVPCAYVGWQAKVVRERRAYPQPIERPYPKGWVEDAGNILLFAEGDRAQAPTGIRIWLGDQAYASVQVDSEASTETKQSVAALFPEAIIWAWKQP